MPALPSKRGGPGGGPRIAILGFSIECNKFAPPATKAHFLARTYLEGDDIVAEARGATPTMLPETPGFVAAMDAAGPWQPVGIALAMSEPNGPVEHDFFEELLATIERRLTAALPLDGVYVCAHGAAVTTEEDDPEGVLFETGAPRSSGRTCRWSRPSICTPTCRTAWSIRSTPLSATARTRISTCASAAPRRPPSCANCSPAWRPSLCGCACRSCRRP